MPWLQEFVTSFAEPPQAGEGLINGGFFVFDWRLAQDGQWMLYRRDGFRQPLDTCRDLRLLNELSATGAAPWQP